MEVLALFQQMDRYQTNHLAVESVENYASDVLGDASSSHNQDYH